MDKEIAKRRHNAAQARYDADNTIRISLKLNIWNDGDILSWLESQPSKQGAIKRLIRAQIAKERQEEWEKKEGE